MVAIFKTHFKLRRKGMDQRSERNWRNDRNRERVKTVGQRCLGTWITKSAPAMCLIWISNRPHSNKPEKAHH